MRAAAKADNSMEQRKRIYFSCGDALETREHLHRVHARALAFRELDLLAVLGHHVNHRVLHRAALHQDVVGVIVPALPAKQERPSSAATAATLSSRGLGVVTVSSLEVLDVSFVSSFSPPLDSLCPVVFVLVADALVQQRLELLGALRKGLGHLILDLHPEVVAVLDLRHVELDPPLDHRKTVQALRKHFCVCLREGEGEGE
eukprot:scaffold2119_cov264-Pinguiococcus_pyrenoidosus.AAC.23